MKIKIICDRSEERSGIPKKLGENFKVLIKKLKVGDYLIKTVPPIRIERKTTSQFLTDWFSGQLNQQISNLLDLSMKNGDLPALLVENDYHVDFKKSLSIEKYCQTELGAYIWVIRTSSKKWTVETIKKLVDLSLEGKLPAKFVRGFGVRRKKNDQISFLTGFWKIDKVLAKRLLKKYGTVRNVIKNSNNWDEDIKGIGQKISKKAKNLLDGVKK